MNKKMSQKDRAIAAIFYLGLLFLIFFCFGGTLSELNSDINIWLYSGALLLILGTYIAEPYFPKPTDTLTNSVSLILTLVAIKDKSIFIGFQVILIFACIMLIISISLLLMQNNSSNKKKILFWVTTSLGNSKVLFSIIYFSSTYSYFEKSKLIVMTAFWFVIMIIKPIDYLIIKIKNLKHNLSNNDDEYLGKAIQYTDPFTYIVESKVKFNEQIYLGSVIAIKQKHNLYHLAVVNDKKILLDNEWSVCYVLQTEEHKPCTFKANELLLSNHYKTIYDLPYESYIIKRCKRNRKEK